MADIRNLSKSVSEESESNVIISGLVPRKAYLNPKIRNVNNRLPDYCRNRMLTFLKHGNINAKTHSNISGLHLNSKSVSLFNESFVNLSKPLDSGNWHKNQNGESNKTVNNEASEDSVVTDREIVGFTKVGLLLKKHIDDLIFGHLSVSSLRKKKRVSLTSDKKSI